MIKNQTEEKLEEAIAPVGPSAKNYDHSPQIEKSIDDKRMLDNEEHEKSSNDSLGAPQNLHIPKSSTMKMLDNTLLELEKLDFKKKENPVDFGNDSSNTA